jgi:hypothetical protein
MNGLDFFRIVEEAFAPFLTELGFSMDAPSISGRLYLARFNNKTHSVNISFEPGDKAFLVLVFTREHGKLSDMDDRIRTPRLADLNSRYIQKISSEERTANETVFRSIHANDNEERLLLKHAKELRLVLPRYLGFTAPLNRSHSPRH